MLILIFTEGTILMHKNAYGLTREEIIKQIQENTDSSIYKWVDYIPIGNSASKLLSWKNKGAKLIYLTSRRNKKEITAIQNVLNRFSFPKGELIFREFGEEYKDVVERLVPDILIEDDCESIGGKKEMIYNHLKTSLKNKIISVIVQEFGGIDHLPDDINILQNF